MLFYFLRVGLEYVVILFFEIENFLIDRGIVINGNWDVFLYLNELYC